MTNWPSPLLLAAVKVVWFTKDSLRSGGGVEFRSSALCCCSRFRSKSRERKTRHTIHASTALSFPLDLLTSATAPVVGWIGVPGNTPPAAAATGDIAGPPMTLCCGGCCMKLGIALLLLSQTPCFASVSPPVKPPVRSFQRDAAKNAAVLLDSTQ